MSQRVISPEGDAKAPDMQVAPSEMAPVPSYGCERCGAPLSPDHIARAEEVTCAHCGFISSLPPDVRAGVRDYVAKTKLLWAETLEARSRGLTQEQSLKVGPLFISMGLAVVSLLFFWFSLTDGKSPVSVSGLCLFLFLISSVASGFLLGRVAGVPSIGLLLASGDGGCLNCGAPIEFIEGSAVARCLHCDFAATVNERIKTDMKLAAARRMNIELSARELRMRHYDSRLNRLGWALFALLGIALLCFLWVARYLFVAFPQTEPRAWLWPTFLVIVCGLGLWGYRGWRRRFEEERGFYDLLDELRSFAD